MVNTCEHYKVVRDGSFGYWLKHCRYFDGEECDRCLKEYNPSSWPIIHRLLDDPEYDGL